MENPSCGPNLESFQRRVNWSQSSEKIFTHFFLWSYVWWLYFQEKLCGTHRGFWKLRKSQWDFFVTDFPENVWGPTRRWWDIVDYENSVKLESLTYVFYKRIDAAKPMASPRLSGRWLNCPMWMRFESKLLRPFHRPLGTEVWEWCTVLFQPTFDTGHTPLRLMS